MIRALVLLLILLRPAMAETARVYSGEHEDFTRLVIELPTSGDWTVGRTPMGYAFALATVNQPVFDISAVWDRIPKNRLQAVRSDPDTGALQLTLACACHVFPFEYQPGVIVLDIKPGPAPPGSVFEVTFSPPVGPSPGSLPNAAPLASFNWLDLDIAPGAGSKPVELDVLTASRSLDPLRRKLIEEISRGASQGVIDMALPGKPPKLAEDVGSPLLWAQINIGPPPDAQLDGLAEDKEGLTPKGQACVPDDKLALAEWGAGSASLDLLAEARGGLYGEFDTLDPQATLRAVRAHLYLGFGAEAAQYARLLHATEAPEDLAVLQSLAHLVDGDQDPKSPFLDMISCDGAAALWSALAQARLPPGGAVNSDAITRSFLALPAHLRAALGPGLVEKLLDHGDADAARILRNSLERTPDVSPATVALMDAKASLHAGEPDAALEHAAEAVAEDGSDVGEWIALVEAHFRKVEPMTQDSVEALQAFEGLIEGPEDQQKYYRALALAELLSGQTDAGFRVAEAQGVPLSDLWHVAAFLAEDDAFLRQAVPFGPQTIAEEPTKEVAKRLVDLGFPDAALSWLEPTGPDDEPESRRIAAEAEFTRGDARRTLLLLAGLAEPKDEGLRAKAFVQLGQIAEARTAYEAAGLADEALRLAAWEKAWPDVAAAGAPLWSSAATDPSRVLPKDAGPLARGAAILEASTDSRASIEALLAGVSAPDP